MLETGSGWPGEAAAVPVRAAVSYQNLAPGGEVWRPGELAGERFRAERNKVTTNVAWLVGAAGGLQESEEKHHIDIAEPGDLQPPSHLAVAPIPGPGYNLARSKTVSGGLAGGERGSPARLAAATNSTMGSLKSRIVRHKTLLGSSSRLYKFSQSLSSLTTITSESRAGSQTSTLK